MTEQQKDFVHQYLKHRDKIVAHNLAYGNNSNYDSVESSANRLLRIPEIAETIRSIQDNIRHEVEQEFKAKYREELLTIYEKRLLLKKIATGEMYIEQKYKGKNCTQCSQYISPTINQMLAALKEDSKLAGHHPFKQNGKWVIPAQQTETEQEEIISTTEKENNGQQLNETIIDNQPLTVEQKNTTETTPLLFLGGDIGAGIYADKRQSGRLTREEQETPDENSLEKDPSERIFIRAGNKRQQSNETNIDNQPLTGELKTNDTPAIISEEKLRELLYPPKPKLSYMKNNT